MYFCYFFSFFFSSNQSFPTCQAMKTFLSFNSTTFNVPAIFFFRFCFCFILSKLFYLQSSGKANVSLAIKDQSPGPKAFQLTGSTLVTTRTLDFETQDSYNVTVVATDSGNPPLSTSLTLTIQVETMFMDFLIFLHYIVSRYFGQDFNYPQKIYILIMNIG